MNAELADRPTSTGMRLRLRWRPVDDGPQGLAEARERLLRQTADAWSEDDRTSVGEFLQAQINAAVPRHGRNVARASDRGTGLPGLASLRDPAPPAR